MKNVFMDVGVPTIAELKMPKTTNIYCSASHKTQELKYIVLGDKKYKLPKPVFVPVSAKFEETMLCLIAQLFCEEVKENKNDND